jgi:hypothetical protein
MLLAGGAAHPAPPASSEVVSPHPSPHSPRDVDFTPLNGQNLESAERGEPAAPGSPAHPSAGPTPTERAIALLAPTVALQARFLDALGEAVIATTPAGQP